MMAAQLLGTGGIAALLLLGAASGVDAIVDVALTLALLAAFATIAFREGGRAGCCRGRRGPPRIDARCGRGVDRRHRRRCDLLPRRYARLLRFPDTFTRLHALTKADNLGLGLVVFGLLPQVDGVVTGLKLVVVWLLVMLAGACASQMVARTARTRASAVTDVLNGGLAALIVALAIWAVFARDAFAAVVGFIAYGLLLTLVWVQLQGVDVALTEAAIGGGLTGALLLGAASRLRRHRGRRARGTTATPVRVAAAALSAA